MKTVYFVRHGLSESNVQGIVSGGEHDALLTNEGKEQATKAGQDLRDKNIDLIVCSPQTRAVETAQLIAVQVGIDKSKILTNEDFIERFMGEYSGKPHQKYRDDIEANKIHESIEPPELLKKRVNRGLQWLQYLDAKNIVLVSHGATGRMVKIIDQNLHHDDMYKIDGFANTEIYKFEL